MQTPPAYPHQAPPPSSGSKTWLIVLLIVGGVVLLIGGTLAVLAIAGVRQYTMLAKTAEAQMNLGVISRDASEAYAKENMGELKPGVPTVYSHDLCGSATSAVPASISLVTAKKYQSTMADWDQDAVKNVGFSCLHFSIDTPQYYQYSYSASGTGASVGDSWLATAKGDLDGDGLPSEFSMGGKVTATDTLTNDQVVRQKNPTE